MTTIGIIMSGVTGRMGANQHLARSILAIAKQGGVRAADGSMIIPEPILTGRDGRKLEALAKAHGGLKWTTDLDAALGDAKNRIFFDSSTTTARAGFVEKAVAAGKAIYCEKPTAISTAEALRLAKLCEDRGVPNGVVQDKLWLPGLRKLAMLKSQGFFGDLLSVRGEFGYWVFTGDVSDQPGQRPSWNYRAEDGGGIISDMLCHWRYVVDNLFGEVEAVSCMGAIHVPERVDEKGQRYRVTAEDSAYATFRCANGVICHFNSSWAVRVRRDDLLTLQVDGTSGSAVAGLRSCWSQHMAATPKPVWNPDVDSPIDFRAGWSEVPSPLVYDNAFKAQWELFLAHVVDGAPFRWTLREGAKGVQLAELGVESWKQRRWVDVPAMQPAGQAAASHAAAR